MPSTAMKVTSPRMPATRKVSASSGASVVEMPHSTSSRSAISAAGSAANLASLRSITAIQWTSLSRSKKNLSPTIARKAPPKPAMPTWAEDTIRSYSRGSLSERLTVSTGPSPAAMATIASGKTMRMPNTAKAMPQVRKRRCQTSSISLRTEALTTALSKLSDISSTDRTATIHSSDNVPVTEAVLTQPYQTARPRQKSVKTNENP